MPVYGQMIIFKIRAIYLINEEDFRIFIEFIEIYLLNNLYKMNYHSFYYIISVGFVLALFLSRAQLISIYVYKIQEWRRVIMGIGIFANSRY